MVLGSATPPPLASVPSSAGPSRTDELAHFEPPYTSKSYGEPPFPPPLLHDVWNDLIKRNPVHTTQMVVTTDPAMHRLNSNVQTSTSGNYEADLARM